MPPLPQEVDMETETRAVKAKSTFNPGRILPVKLLAIIAVVAASCFMLQAAVPEGWLIAGSQPSKYESGVDTRTLLDGRPSAYLKAKEPVTGGFGTLMQAFDAKNYAGKRMRFSGQVKADGVQSWAGLWMRVDKGSESVAFDNMQDRPIKGTSDWKRYDVVLDVPQDASGVFFGILLDGSGEVWLSDVKFEVVGTEIPTTGGTKPRPAGPVNLDFQKQ
jgi:hypothetical protein